MVKTNQMKHCMSQKPSNHVMHAHTIFFRLAGSSVQTYNYLPQMERQGRIDNQELLTFPGGKAENIGWGVNFTIITV